MDVHSLESATVNSLVYKTAEFRADNLLDVIQSNSPTL